MLTLGYTKASLIGLHGGLRKEYYVKPRYNESPEHFFVTKMIGEYIKQYTDQVELHVSQEPDVVFEINGQKIAIEVETGDKYKNARKKLLAKVEKLNKEYKNWFFVVTDWRFKEKYQKFAPTYVRKEIPSLVKELQSVPVEI
ncbi:MAG: hypothetical protein ACE5FT_03390 [Candidatus Nanoarchaeia archaeon]